MCENIRVPPPPPPHGAPAILSIDKSLSRNRYRVWSPNHQRTIKEESKMANRDWVDRQAHLSFHLLQCINQTCVMKKMDMFPMNKKGLKSDRIVHFPCQ